MHKVYLVYEMPIDAYSWSERLRRWLEWKQSSSRGEEMPAYGAELMPNDEIKNKENARRNLRKEYERVKARVEPWCPKKSLSNSVKEEELPFPWEKQEESGGQQKKAS